MSDHILPRRFRYGQTDSFSFSSLDSDTSSLHGPAQIAEASPDDTSTGLPYDFLQDIDISPLRNHERSKGTEPAVEKPPYSQLDREASVIRLINISRSTTADQVHCHLTTHSLTQAPKYTALSYTWGRPDSACSILLNGLHFPVRKNLWRFLREVQHSSAGDDTLFWIDALCIDQRDESERTHQVGLMSKIYGTAERVLVWLGPSYGDSELALQVLSKWSSRQKRPASELSKVWWRPQGASLRKLCERPYWSRLWVLQEMVLAKEVLLVCGSRHAPGKALSEFLLRARSLPPGAHRHDNYEYEPTMRSRAMSILEQMQQADHTLSLLDQMRVSQKLNCFEPRDKVYALLGIVKRGHEGISPDYTIGLPSLLNTVLRNEHKHLPPKDLVSVKKQCQELCNYVGVPVTTIFLLEDQAKVKAPPGEDVGQTRLIDFESGLTLWWTRLYGHEDVADLLMFKLGRSQLFTDHVVQLARDGGADALRFWFETSTIYDDASDNKGRNLLAVAAAAGQTAAVNILLGQSSINANARDHSGQAAIHIAACYGVTEVLKSLIAHSKVDVNGFDNDRCTPLHLAIKWGRDRCIQLLLSRVDLDMNLASSWSQTPLEYAVWQGRADIVEMLLERDDLEVSPTKCGFRWRSPLHTSIRMKNDDVAAALLARRDLDVNAVDERGYPALHVALREGTEHAVTQLLHNSDITLRSHDVNGDTPLHLAVRYEHDQIVVEMLRIYCYLGMFPASLQLLNARNYLNLGETSVPGYRYKRTATRARMEAYLEKESRSPSFGFSKSVKAEFLPMKASDLERWHQVDINATNGRGNSPLHEAILKWRDNAARLLLTMPGINVNLTNREGISPLHMAAACGNESVTKLLLLHKSIDINLRTFAGILALEFASIAGHTSIVRLLLFMNDSDSPADHGLLEIACRHDQLEMSAHDERMGAERFGCEELESLPLESAGPENLREEALFANSVGVTMPLPDRRLKRLSSGAVPIAGARMLGEPSPVDIAQHSTLATRPHPLEETETYTYVDVLTQGMLARGFTGDHIAREDDSLSDFHQALGCKSAKSRVSRRAFIY